MAPYPSVLDTVVHVVASATNTTNAVDVTNATLNATATASAGAASELPLGYNALIAFGAVCLAALQGALVMASGDPCHISNNKWTVLVVLQALEAVVVCIALAESFLEFHSAFGERLQWLYWVPPCLVTLSLLQLFTDVCWTLRLGMQSRFNWTPLSSAGYDVKSGTGLRAFFSFLSMGFTAAFAVVLVGWRVRWWLVAPPVSEAIATEAASVNHALSDGVFAYALGWGLALSLMSFVVVLFVEVAKSLVTYGRLFHALYTKESKLTQEQQNNLKTVPLHVASAVLRSNKFRILDDLFSVLRYCALLIENFSIVPLLSCVVTAVLQLHDKLDAPTLLTLKELVDAVIVAALVELAIGFKSFLWSFAYVDEVHAYDKMDSQSLITNEK